MAATIHGAAGSAATGMPKAKLKILVTHSFRTSAAIFKEQVTFEACRLTGAVPVNPPPPASRSNSRSLQLQRSGLDKALDDLIELVRS
jgi:hypothetical protein